LESPAEPLRPAGRDLCADVPQDVGCGARRGSRDKDPAVIRVRIGAETLKTIDAIVAVVITVTALVATGAAQAAEDTAFGAKPWLFSPPPGKLTPLRKHRASVYRSNLQREIRRLELKGPLTSIRSMDRLNTFRSELSRIERATRSRRRR